MTTETSNARGEWVLVPREPTEAMIGAFKQAHDEHAALRIPKVYAKGQREAANVVVGYRAMLAAAPPPAAARGDVRELVAQLEKRCVEELEASRDRNWGEWVRDQHTGRHSGLAEAKGMLEAALAAEGVQAGEVEQLARELLAAELRADLRPGAAEEAESGKLDHDPAMRAIVAALSQQPEARGVVDVLTEIRDDALRCATADTIGGDNDALKRAMRRLADKCDAALTGERNG